MVADKGLNTLRDALSAAFVKGDVLLKDAPTALGMQYELAGERFERRAKLMGMSDVMILSAAERGKDATGFASDWCDSPIEKRLLPWLIFEDYGERILTMPARVHNPLKQVALPEGDLIVIPQFRFAKYRMDFAIVTKIAGIVRFVCVECDGEGEHTAEHDVPRDAYLLQWGIPTIRATGKEIYREPGAVSARAASAVRAQIEG